MGFFLTLLSSIFAIDLFVWWRGGRGLKKAPFALRGAFHGFMAFEVGALGLIVAARMRGVNLDAWFPTPLYSAVFLWHLLVLPLAFFLDLGRLLAAGARRLAYWVARRRPAEPLPGGGMSRREFLGAAATLTPPFLSLALGAIATGQLSHFRVRRLTVTLPSLPPNLDGATIAHLSDFHVGRFTHGRVLREIIEATNALKADLALFTGDLINDSTGWLPQAVEALQQIDRPVVLCEGNHDLIENPRTFRETLKAAKGLSLLVDEAETLPLRGERVQLLGLGWSFRPRRGRQVETQSPLQTRMAALLRRREEGAFPILLAHHPHAWDESGEIPLTLAGHTHGGQLMLSETAGAGPLMFRYWSGLYTRGAQALVVSNGTGNWFPLRVGAPAEIIHLTLRRA